MIQPSRLDSGHFNLVHACDELPASVTRHFLETAYSTAFRISLSGCFLVKSTSIDYVVNVIYTSRFDKKTSDRKSTSELQSRGHLVCRLLLEKKKINNSQVIDLCIVQL